MRTMGYSLDQALRARSVLRSAAGLGEETFNENELVGMLSDEIRALRDKGSSEEDIAGILQTQADVRVLPEALRNLPEEGQWHK